MSTGEHGTENSITEITRREIFDHMRLEKVDWSGRLDEVAFLARIYPLSSMPSTDPRRSDAEGDIRQHRLNWSDWDDDWIFDDTRFELQRGSDEILLRFLCELVHPVVRSDRAEVEQLVAMFNKHLRADGWELYPATFISERPVYAPRRLVEIEPPAISAALDAASTLDSEYIQQQITRMQISMTADPELAIGTAKEFLESICKTVIARAGATPASDELPGLIRCALEQVEVDLEGAEDPVRAAKAVQRLLGNLSGVGGAVGEVRNAVGSGHGKPANTRQPEPMYARLVVGAATTLGLFLFDTILTVDDADTE